jgi:hypothetical protein
MASARTGMPELFRRRELDESCSVLGTEPVTGRLEWLSCVPFMGEPRHFR